MNPSLLLLHLGFVGLSWGFNLDEEYPVVLRGSPGSYFGFSVAFHHNSSGNWALVAAIRANSSLKDWQSIYEPGVLYSCPLLEDGSNCTEVTVEVTGNRDTPADIESMRYFDLKDNMTLGMSLDTAPDGKVVVCGPLWKNKKWPSVYLANGVCYVLDQRLKSSQKLLPLVRRTQQAVNLDYYYYAAEFGFSAAFTSQGGLVLGTPGFSNWEGTVIRYDAALSYSVPPALLGKKEKDTYKGYAVATGHIFKGPEVTVAAGAPRSNEYKGEVYLFSFRVPGNVRGVVIKGRLYGGQMCEYFGASLAAVDLDKDGDGYDDLLVGAPLYTQTGGIDEGRVYVYKSNGAGLYFRSALEGSRSPSARFGTAIAGVGDLNLDGYQDVAVGAPYENDVGAVYIYHGSAIFNERPNYAQRIEASSISLRTGVPFKGFGISISRGFDMDNNHYDDILVGSYASDAAVLFRSRPVAQLIGSVDADLAMITADIENCDLPDGRPKQPCFRFTACVRYLGRFVSSTVDVETVLSIDVKRQLDNRPVRGFMIENATDVDRSTTLVTVRANQTACEKKVVYLQATFTDPVTPFETRFAYRLREPSDQRWCPNCPVLDKDVRQYVTKTIAYQHGCGDDDVCRSDMKLDVVILNYDTSSPLIAGEQQVVSVAVRVQNKRSVDPAYLARVVVTAPATVRVVNKDRCSVQKDRNIAQEKVLIVCDAGNPLRPSQAEHFLLKLDMSQVQASFTLTAYATTTSEEATPDDNKVEMALQFVHQADIAMLGKAKPEVVTFNSDTKSISMEHSFVLAKQYASPINQVELSLHVPYVFSESQPPISYLKMVKVYQGDLFVPGTCRSVEGYFTHNDTATTGQATTESTPASSKNGTSVAGRVQRSVPDSEVRSEGRVGLMYDNVPPLNCKTSLCQEIKCVMGPFLNRHRISQITLHVVLNMTEFTRQAGIWHAFSIGSEGVLKILDNTSFITGADYRKEIRVATILQKEGPPPAKKVEAWIIAASAFGGLVLFSLIIAGLIHLGFFRRQQREALEKLLKEENQNEWNEFMVTEAEVEAEKEYFRKSMMTGMENFNIEDFQDSPQMDSAESTVDDEDKPVV